jgi:Na+/alanine symporter
MGQLVKLIGIIIVAFSVVYTVKPATIKKTINFWTRQKRIYWGAVLNLLLGFILLRASGACTLPWFVALMGVLSLLKGILIFVLRKKKVLDWTESIIKKPPKVLRTLGIIGIAIGACLIYAA